jgi:hypothetical protein
MQEVYTTLPIGTIVQGQYVVEDVLDKGEFSVVYLVRDKRSNQSHFSLKEVIAPKRKEQQRVPVGAITLKRLNHLALPQVYDVFYDAKLGRAYMLMDYIGGASLEVLHQEQPEQRFSLPEVMTCIVTNDARQASFSFAGVIQPDRTIAGTYCSLAEATGKCSDYGLWSVSPAI